MNAGSVAPEQLYDYQVMDSSGDKLGTVDHVWVDDATDQLEFIGVKTGWIMAKTHIIPALNARIENETIHLPYSTEQIKGAPHFPPDAHLSQEEEDEIYRYYGLQPMGTGVVDSGLAATTPAAAAAMTSPTATVAPTTDTTLDAGVSNAQSTTVDAGYRAPAATGRDVTRDDEARVTLSEEQVNVGKREVEAGRVRLRKVVQTEQVSQPVELRQEEVVVEHVPASGAAVPAGAFRDETVEVPVMREEAVVTKEAHVTGEARIRKTADTTTETVTEDVRRERVEVEQEGDTTRGTGRV